MVPAGGRRAGAAVKLAVQVEANGELDAAVDVFVKQRSQNLPVTCQRTDKHGEAVFAFTPQKQTTYLIRVAQLANSDSGTFSLHVFQPPPAATPPGTPLAAQGASGSLARVVDVSSAYSAQLTAGVSYQVNLVSRIKGCMRLAIFAPGTTTFDSGSPVGGLQLSGVSAVHAAPQRPLQPARRSRRVRPGGAAATTCSWRPRPPPRRPRG